MKRCCAVVWMAMGLMSAAGFAQGRLLVVEKGAQSLGIVDAASGKEIASVAEGGVTGHEVAASRDGRLAFVPIYGNSGVGAPGTDGTEMVVIDVAAAKVIARVDFGHGVRPHLPVLGPPVKGYPEGLLYVTTELDKAIAIVDPKTFRILGSVPTGAAESHMLAVSHDGKWGYTANVGPGTVSVLDLNAKKVVTTIPISSNTQRISISMDDSMVFTSDQAKPQLAVIDTKTNTVKKWVPMEGTGYGSAPTPDGRWLLVAMNVVNKVAVVDLRTLEVVRNIDVAANPQAVLVRPDGKAAYVSCGKSGEVDEIVLGSNNVASWKVTRTIATGKVADGMAWAK